MGSKINLHAENGEKFYYLSFKVPEGHSNQLITNYF